MAIPHYSLETISRSAGRSATGASAYRACTRIRDERTCEVFDYRRKRGLAGAFTILADGLEIDRAQLWNAAEAAENRRNSVVARELKIALPAELDEVERLDLAREHALYLAQRHKVAVDVAIHLPDRRGDERNHHAHFLFTTRSVAADIDGTLRFGGKTRELDERRTGSQHLKEWRLAWQEHVNERLRSLNKDRPPNEQIPLLDMRTLEAQGIDRKPGIHLGPAATNTRRKAYAVLRERALLYISDDPARRAEARQLRLEHQTAAPVSTIKVPIQLPITAQASDPSSDRLLGAPSTEAKQPDPILLVQQIDAIPLVHPLEHPEPGKKRSKAFKGAAISLIHAIRTGDRSPLDAASDLLKVIFGRVAREVVVGLYKWSSANPDTQLPKPWSVDECRRVARIEERKRRPSSGQDQGPEL